MIKRTPTAEHEVGAHAGSRPPPSGFGGFLNRIPAPRPFTGPHVARELVAVAVGLGVAAERLLRAGPWGLNLPLWTAVLVVAVLLIAHRWRVELRGEGRWTLPLALLFAAGVAWRASETLAVFNVGMTLVLLALAGWRAREGRLRTAPLAAYLRNVAVAGVHAAAGCLVLLVREVRWPRIAVGRDDARAAGLARGALLGLPLLVVFGSLFAAADPMFGRVVARLFRGGPEHLIPTLLWIGFWGWISAGFLRLLLFRVADEPRTPWRNGRPALGTTELVTSLGLLNALFGVFVLFQLRYLFGGAGRVEVTAGLTYAEYARHGFFELVAVAVLLLPLLLAANTVAVADDDRALRPFRALAGGLIGLTFVVMASAMYRMRLYVAEYGLTEDRLLASSMMVWLAIVFGWFVRTVLMRRPDRFAWGALAAGAAVLAALNVADPEALIARANLERGTRGERFDGRYLDQLGADAVPVIVSNLDALAERDRCHLAARMLDRWGGEPRGDWRTWNRGRARARAAVAAARPAWERTACADTGGA